MVRNRCVFDYDLILYYKVVKMTTITIPQKINKNRDLIVIPRKEYEILLDAFKILKEKKQVTAEDILRWSKEAKKLKRAGRLPLLRSLKDLR